jgi:hypothetical protein
MPLKKQINDFPANRLFSRMQISCDSSRIESNDDCGAVASIFTDLETSLAGNLSVVEALSKAGAQTIGTELTLVFQPHLSLFRLGYGIQGGSWNLELFPKTSQPSTDLVAAIFNQFTQQTSNVNLDGGGGAEEAKLDATSVVAEALGVTSSTTASITSVSLMAAFGSPQVPRPIQGTLRHLLGTTHVQTLESTSANAQQNFTIPASTFYVSLFVVEKASALLTEKGAVQGGLQSYSIRYGGNLYPFSPHENLITHGSALRAYVDVASSRMSLEASEEYPRQFEDWKAKPVYGHRVYKSSADSATSLDLRVQFDSSSNASAARVVLVCHSNELLSMDYSAGELTSNSVVPIV